MATLRTGYRWRFRFHNGGDARDFVRGGLSPLRNHRWKHKEKLGQGSCEIDNSFCIFFGW